MPSYNYVCSKCGTPQEITKPISRSSDPETCSEITGNTADETFVCGAPLQRDFNGQASTFALRGNGWTGNSLTKRGRR